MRRKPCAGAMRDRVIVVKVAKVSDGAGGWVEETQRHGILGKLERGAPRSSVTGQVLADAGNGTLYTYHGRRVSSGDRLEVRGEVWRVVAPVNYFMGTPFSFGLERLGWISEV